MHGKQTNAKPLKKKMGVDESWVIVAQKGGSETAKKTGSSVLKSHEEPAFWWEKHQHAATNVFLSFKAGGRAQQ